MVDPRSEHVEPRAEFVERLEMNLLERLIGPDPAWTYEARLVTRGDELTQMRRESTPGRRPNAWRSRWLVVVAAAAAVAVLFVTLAIIRKDADEDAAGTAAPPAAIAIAGAISTGTTSDILLVAPDGTSSELLTSTPDLIEALPAWSPDGNRLAFVRSDPAPGDESAAACRATCELVVVDPATGTETLTVDIAHAGTDGDSLNSMVPTAVDWAPDGTAIAIPMMWCGRGGCGQVGRIGSVVVDLTSGDVISTEPEYEVRAWSPDGRWLAVVVTPGGFEGPLLLVPAEPLDALARLSTRADVRTLVDGIGEGSDVAWGPDSSSIYFARGGGLDTPSPIEVVSVSDGARTTVVAHGSDPVLSPDGRRLAYVSASDIDASNRSPMEDVWVADVDGSNVRRIAMGADQPVWAPDGQRLVLHQGNGFITVDIDGVRLATLPVRTAEIGLPFGDGATAAWNHVGAP